MDNYNSYHDEIIDKYNMKTKNLLAELPPYVTTYEKGLSKKQPRTKCAYIQDIYIFFQFLKKHVKSLNSICIRDIPISVLDELTIDDIDTFLEYVERYDNDGVVCRNSDIGKARKLSAVRSLYHSLNKRGMISHNPASLAETPKVAEKNIRILDADERNLLLETVINGTTDSGKSAEIHEILMKRDYAIMCVFFGTGMRVSELVGINLNDINWTLHKINIVRKGGNADYVYISEEVEDALDDYVANCRDLLKPLSDETALFISRKRGRMSVRSVEQMVKRYANSALGTNNHITPHKMRSTYGTQLYDETGDIYLVATALGHKSVDTTRKHYAKMSDAKKKQASNVRIWSD